MAKGRDIIIGLIIGFSFLIFILFMGIAMMSRGAGSGLEWASFGNKVAIVNITGEIFSSQDIVRQLDRWGEDNNVKAIVLRVNSPGGGVAPSQEIYQKTLNVQEESGKPIVVSMGSVCASGGYYIACAGEKIVANPGTLTGSIGVLLQWPIMGEMLDKIGIQFETIKSGSSKDIGSSWREPTEADREILQRVVDDTYEQFVEILVEQRGLSTSEVIQIADGSIFSGRQALDVGLVDQLGTFEDAIDLAGELAGIGRDPDTITERPRRRVGWLDLLGSILNIDMSQLPLNGDGNVYPQLRYILK